MLGNIEKHALVQLEEGREAAMLVAGDVPEAKKAMQKFYDEAIKAVKKFKGKPVSLTNEEYAAKIMEAIKPHLQTLKASTSGSSGLVQMHVNNIEASVKTLERDLRSIKSPPPMTMYAGRVEKPEKYGLQQPSTAVPVRAAAPETVAPRKASDVAQNPSAPVVAATPRRDSIHEAPAAATPRRDSLHEPPPQKHEAHATTASTNIAEQAMKKMSDLTMHQRMGSAENLVLIMAAGKKLQKLAANSKIDEIARSVEVSKILSDIVMSAKGKPHGGIVTKIADEVSQHCFGEKLEISQEQSRAKRRAIIPGLSEASKFQAEPTKNKPK
ncbi:MAG: hypothetical protein JSR17_08345 [Proteobacteria bacterium]|nr:hypothetical protein [Pseudomonadota bacterium]